MRLGSTVRRLIVLSIGVGAAALQAQSFSLDRGREPVVSLDGQWRFHPGDSPRSAATSAPAWAATGFDDSAWPLLRGDSSWAYQGYPAMSGYAWYRFTVEVPPGDKPASLLLAPIVTAFEVYADGRLVGGSGQMPPTRAPNTGFSFHRFPLTQAGSRSPRTVQVAIRVWHSPIWASYVGGGPFEPGSLAGDPELLAIEQHHQQLARNTLFVDMYAYSIAAGLIGLVFLYLIFMRPGEREYLWFGILLLAEALDNALSVSKEIYAVPPIPVFDLLDAILNAAIVAAMFLFFARVLRARLRVGRRILLGLLAISPFTAVLYWPGWCSAPVSAALQLFFMLPAMLWILFLLVQRSVSGNKDARLLLLPVLLTEGYWTADNLIVLLAQAGWVQRPEWMEYPLPLPPFTMHTQILLNLVFLLAMLIFLIRRFSLARRLEERMAGELEAARQVQQVLLPDELDRCAGFAVECIYRPAHEVGGDFFQQIGDGHGGMSIVVGDVSGKGLPAAMLVSVLVGAIRAEAGHGAGPVAMLAALNERMIGRSRGGFTTCLAAHLTAEGVLTIANAGHLPPYLNGEEIGIPGALPLGIIALPDYQCGTLQLAPGDRLTFVSDGVVEAQSRAGELFGFERTRAISTAPAGRIAEAAQSFGQSDDITVVTVEFSGVPVEMTGPLVS
jgi:hypothetical protein